MKILLKSLNICQQLAAFSHKTNNNEMWTSIVVYWISPRKWIHKTRYRKKKTLSKKSISM